MPALTAIDAIKPAWHHTRRLLLNRRDWRVLLKIGAVAVFAQMGGCNFNLSTPGGPGQTGDLHWPAPAVLAAILLAVGCVVLVVGLAFFYLGSRLQFVLFEVVLRRDTLVSPIWRRYGKLTWRWMGLKLLFFLVALICMLPLLVPTILFFVHSVRNSPDQHPAEFILGILTFILSIFVLIFFVSSAYVLLQDFGLPSLALESTPMRITVTRLVAFIRGEPLEIFLYLVMRFLLSLAGAIASYIALLIAILIALIPFGGLGALLYFGLHTGGLAARVFMVAGWVVLGLAFGLIFFTAAIILFGYMLTFLQAYAIYFLAGRYPLLDSILHPAPPAPPPFFPPPPPSPIVA